MAADTLTLADFEKATESGKIFNVGFFKRTGGGEFRVMTCRRGVTKGVKGVGLKFDPKERNLLVVYDMQKIEEGKDEKGAFRMINLSDLVDLKLEGKAYKWNNTAQVFKAV